MSVPIHSYYFMGVILILLQLKTLSFIINFSYFLNNKHKTDICLTKSGNNIEANQKTYHFKTESCLLPNKYYTHTKFYLYITDGCLRKMFSINNENFCHNLIRQIP